MAQDHSASASSVLDGYTQPPVDSNDSEELLNLPPGQAEVGGVEDDGNKENTPDERHSSEKSTLDVPDNARNDDEADVDANDLLLQPLQFNYSLWRAERMLENTQAKLVKDGRGPVGSAEKKAAAAIKRDSLDFVRLMHPTIVEKRCVHNGKFLLRKMEGPLSTLAGGYRKWVPLTATSRCTAIDDHNWKTGCTNGEEKGLIGRVEPQVKAENPDMSAEDIAVIVKKRSFIYLTLEESLDIVSERPELEAIVRRIALAAPACQVYEDHEEKAFGEVLNYLMELTFASTFNGILGYAMEKPLNFGRHEVRLMVEPPPREANADAISALKGTGARVLTTTWPHLKSATYDHLMTSELDEATRAASGAMLDPAPRDVFMKNNLSKRMCANSNDLQPYMDAVETSAPFEAARSAAQRMGDAIMSGADTASQQRIIWDSIASINKASHYAVSYDPPSEELYIAGAANILGKAISAAILSDARKVLILIERDSKNRLEEAIQDKYFPPESVISIVRRDGKQAGELWRIPHEVQRDIPTGKTINVLVTSSAHVILGVNNTYCQRMENCINYLTYMSIFEEAGMNPPGSLEVEQKIMRAAFMESDGYSGEIERGSGSFSFKARRMAMPKGFLLNPIKPGVRAIGNAISVPHGIHDFYVPALMGLLRHDKFAQMMRIGFDIDVGPAEDTATLLSKFPSIISERIKAIESKPEPDRNEWELKLLEKDKAERERQKKNRKERRAKKKEKVDAIEGKAETDRDEWERKLLEKHEAEREASSEYKKEWRANTKEKVDAIKGKAETDRDEWESKLLEKHEAQRDKKSEREKEYRAANKDKKSEYNKEYYRKHSKRRIEEEPSLQEMEERYANFELQQRLRQEMEERHANFESQERLRHQEMEERYASFELQQRLRQASEQFYRGRIMQENILHQLQFKAPERLRQTTQQFYLGRTRQENILQQLQQYPHLFTSTSLLYQNY